MIQLPSERGDDITMAVESADAIRDRERKLTFWIFAGVCVVFGLLAYFKGGSPEDGSDHQAPAESVEISSQIAPE